MATATRQPDVSLTQAPGKGNWGQRFPNIYRKPQGFPGWIRPGTSIIQGYIEIGSSGATSCRAILLYEDSGVLVDETEIKDGAYLFRFLAPGNYAVVILDTLGRFRAEVIHTVVP